MRVREAKDFLVQQVAKQAALENVPLSELEKRMMYFTESGECPEDPIGLNDAFEAEYDTGKYETKISKLLHLAYKRVRDEGGASLQTWNDAIRRLKRGDHYLLVMWDLAPYTWTRVRDSGKLFASALGVIAIACIVFYISKKLEPQWAWLQERLQTYWRVLFGLFVTIFLAVLIFPRRVGNAMDWLLDHAFGLFRPKEDEKDSE